MPAVLLCLPRISPRSSTMQRPASLSTTSLGRRHGGCHNASERAARWGKLQSGAGAGASTDRLPRGDSRAGEGVKPQSSFLRTWTATASSDPPQPSRAGWSVRPGHPTMNLRLDRENTLKGPESWPSNAPTARRGIHRAARNRVSGRNPARARAVRGLARGRAAGPGTDPHRAGGRRPVRRHTGLIDRGRSPVPAMIAATGLARGPRSPGRARTSSRASRNGCKRSWRRRGWARVAAARS